MTNYVARPERVGKGSGTFAAGGLGTGSAACIVAVEKYYDAYDKYLRLFASDDGVVAGDGKSGVCGGRGSCCVEAPVWVGYSGLSTGVFVGNVGAVAGVLDVDRGSLLGKFGDAVERESAQASDFVASGVVKDDCGVDGFVHSDGGASGVGDTGGQSEVSSGESSVRGKNYLKNKMKRERVKLMRRSVVKDSKDVCPSLSGSVCTVDTRTANEIEAADTLASCRAAENKVKQKMAELRLQSLNNKDKTNAVLRLEAARMEQRINDAKARSQASFKKCDQSLKSLGSTGSAGEYALKQEVKKGKDAEVKLEYSQRQLRMFYEHATPDVRQMVANIPEPTFESYIDVFGDCPSEFDEEEAQAYYDDLSLRTAEAGLI